MTVPSAPDLVRVHMVGLPVPIAAKAQQHFEELMREFELIAAAAAEDEDGPAVPARLMRLVSSLRQQYGGVNSAADQRLAEAIDSGAEVMEDHVMDLPRDAGPASQVLGDLIDEADEYCRRGQHLLTLASPADCVRYRRWFLAEVTQQLEGRPPQPWPEFAAAHSS